MVARCGTYETSNTHLRSCQPSWSSQKYDTLWPALRVLHPPAKVSVVIGIERNIPDTNLKLTNCRSPVPPVAGRTGLKLDVAAISGDRSNITKERRG